MMADDFLAAGVAMVATVLAADVASVATALPAGVASVVTVLAAGVATVATVLVAGGLRLLLSWQPVGYACYCQRVLHLKCTLLRSLI